MSPSTEPVVSNDPDDLTVPGVTVAFDADEADLLGAFEDDSLTPDNARMSNRSVRP